VRRRRRELRPPVPYATTDRECARNQFVVVPLTPLVGSVRRSRATSVGAPFASPEPVRHERSLGDDERYGHGERGDGEEREDGLESGCLEVVSIRYRVESGCRTSSIRYEARTAVSERDRLLRGR
jgi:hypothetical protein